MARVLAVDDNEDILLLLEHVLRASGFEVSAAAGGREAIARLRAGDGRPPDVVVLDVQMPEMDGWETLVAIRHEPATAHLPVIMCTVKGRPDDQIRGWELGCDGYVTKPFDIGALADEVGSVLSRTPEERRGARSAGLEAARREAAIRAR